jgi:hypothetical protein
VHVVRPSLAQAGSRKNNGGFPSITVMRPAGSLTSFARPAMSARLLSGRSELVAAAAAYLRKRLRRVGQRSETHWFALGRRKMMGLAALNPSYGYLISRSSARWRRQERKRLLWQSLKN